ncbi:flavin reductase like protein [Hypnocyclicus thermotrophus]|uniref:Flavin reductase like protein n=1 Tax=Hypnocyclicus thermotrophus TaxID=1627895 RepID=A0AA46I5J3_9FUSO|nr:flavin reductase [Hypnocyclicus thermotrophus]TDT70477.1 flavin reductase like protein [Hypnocyclicus thermotrophus]
MKKFNVFEKIGKDWMLISAQKEDKINTMTASWGGMGVLWNKEVVYIFVRPQRYTREFIDASEYFTLSFFDKEYKKELDYLGKVSGRELDKIKETSLIPAIEDGKVYFEQANMVIYCKKIYRQHLTPESFIDKKIEEFYENDYHIMYIGEIVEIMENYTEE